MKKSILFIILMTVFSLAFALDYTVELVDSYGDGWNGGSLTVSVNGTPVLTGITLASGGGPEVHNFTCAGGDAITTAYTAGGWSYENEYQIKNEVGTVVAQDGQGGATPAAGGVSYNVPAAGGPGQPTTPSPADAATGIALSGNLTWDWGADSDTYDLWFGPTGAMAQVVTGATCGASGSYAYSGLSYTTGYEWQVIIYNANRATTNGATWGFTTLLDPSIIQIGSGATTGQGIPIEPYYGYTYSQSIYLSSDFGTPGADKRIEKIYYNYSWSTSGDDDSDDWVVYMNTTADTDLDTAWLPIAGFTEVFNGDVDLQLVSGTGWLEITLDTPFNYNPVTDGNLVIAVDENTPSYCGSSDEFLCDLDSRANVTRHYHSDSTNLDPAAPSQAGAAIAYYPNTRFVFGDVPAQAVLGVSPTTFDFGSVPNNTCSANQAFTLSNTGTGTINIASAVLVGGDAAQFSIDVDPTPVTINPAADVEIQFCPTSVGAKSTTLRITDNLRAVTDIPLSGTGWDDTGDTCANPFTVGALPYTDTQDTRTINGWTNTYGNTSNDIWYEWTVTSPGIYDIYTCNPPNTGTDYDTYIRLVGSDCLTELAFNDDNSGMGCLSNSSWMTVNIGAAGTYYICAEGYASSNGAYEMTVEFNSLDLATSSVWISEVCDDNTGDVTDNLAFIELYNNEISPVWIGGAKIIAGTTTGGVFTADDPEVAYSIPDGTKMAGKSYFAIAAGAAVADFNTAWGTTLVDGTNFNSGSAAIYLATEGHSWQLDTGTIGRAEKDKTENITSTGREVQDVPGNWDHGTEPDETINGAPGTQGEGENPLPVILSSFTAEYVAENLTIFWITQSESNNIGWNVYRGDSEYAWINDNIRQINVEMIEGAGTSTEPTPYSYIDAEPVMEEETYWYWLESVDMSGSTQLYMPFSYTIPTGGDDPVPPTEAVVWGLHGNHPNPFNPVTTVEFGLKESGNVKIYIYNAKGQKVKTLVDKYYSVDAELGSSESERWLGKDDAGKSVGSGVYYYKLEAEGKTDIKKMILLK